VFDDLASTLSNLISSNAFPKNRKLKTDEISSVFNFRHRINAEYLSFFVRGNQQQVARMAVIVSKKILRSAVKRNYCKRVIRELFRSRQEKLSGVDVVIQVKKGFSSVQFGTVVNEFDTITSKIH
jgi:ribonuclease P protein component